MYLTEHPLGCRCRTRRTSASHGQIDQDAVFTLGERPRVRSECSRSHQPVVSYRGSPERSASYRRLGDSVRRGRIRRTARCGRRGQRLGRVPSPQAIGGPRSGGTATENIRASSGSLGPATPRGGGDPGSAAASVTSSITDCWISQALHRCPPALSSVCWCPASRRAPPVTKTKPPTKAQTTHRIRP